MPVAGYVFTLVGILLLRQVITGRAKETPADVRDLAIAFFNGDIEGIKTVASARGENVGTGSAGEVATGSGSVPTPSNQFAKAVVELGSKASGYRLGATGPDYYDCSGLIWRAAKNAGIFNGPRFTTHNFAMVAKPYWQQVDSPSQGDIVLWRARHMGVSLGGDAMYSARSTAKGIGQSTISGDSDYFGFKPTYWRVVQGPRLGG